jgi:hypothetical protein
MIFFDAQTVAASISVVTIAETGGMVLTTQISGVYYYFTGSQFTVDIADIDDLNEESYPNIQVIVTGANFGLPQLNLTGANLTGWTNAYNDINDTYQKTDWAISAANYCFSGNVSATATVQDWVSGASASSVNTPVLVNTYVANSTRIFEDFRTETRRRTSAWAAWNSTQDLTTYDGNQGLQVRCSRLIYPSIDYGAYNPFSGVQPNYTACTGTRSFFWSIYHTDVSHSSGRFVFGDHNITDSDAFINGYFKIEISKNGADWYNCCAPYLGGAILPGAGCRVMGAYSLDSNSSIEWTLGTGGFTDGLTGPSPEGWGLYVRLFFTSNISAKYIGSLQESTWV